MEQPLTTFDRRIYSLAPTTRQRQSERGTTVTVTVQHKPMPTHWGPLSNPSVLVRFDTGERRLLARPVAQAQADEAVRRWLALGCALPPESARVRVVAGDDDATAAFSETDTQALLALLRDWPAP